MNPNNQKKMIFIYNYICSPAFVILMFWTFYFKGERFSIQKIIDNRCDPKLYLAFMLAIISLMFFRYGNKFPKDENK